MRLDTSGQYTVEEKVAHSFLCRLNDRNDDNNNNHGDGNTNDDSHLDACQ